MKCLLRRTLDTSEFLSEYGVRSLSRHHLAAPYVFAERGHDLVVSYEPAEATSALFGGNSNWRGPIWFPVNFLLIESLGRFHHYYGDDFRIEHPTGSGTFMSLGDVADELTSRLTRLFAAAPSGRIANVRQHGALATDAHFRDHVLFHEFFDGDTGAGLGASHQTGWTGLIAMLLQPRAAPR
jgi:hypothetical protein